MSFAQDVKQEIAARKITRPCCSLAACYGFACFGRYFDQNGTVLQTESLPVAQLARRMFAMNGVQGELVEKNRPSGSIWEFAVKEPAQVARLLQLLGHTGQEASLRINPRLFRCPQCASAYMGAAFLCCGTVTDPQKEYHLEFMTGRLNLAKDFEALLAEHEFHPHRTRRKGINVVYLKASEPIEDILTFMGATGGAMKIMDHKSYKELRNKTNRINNCDMANMDKVATANVQALRAIAFLETSGALDVLPEPLRQAASMRREYPDLPLAALAARFDPPISKSGLSHRLKRLEKMAAQMQERQKS